MSAPISAATMDGQAGPFDPEAAGVLSVLVIRSSS